MATARRPYRPRHRPGLKAQSKEAWLREGVVGFMNVARDPRTGLWYASTLADLPEVDPGEPEVPPRVEAWWKRMRRSIQVSGGDIHQDIAVSVLLNLFLEDRRTEGRRRGRAAFLYADALAKTYEPKMAKAMIDLGVESDKRAAKKAAFAQFNSILYQMSNLGLIKITKHRGVSDSISLGPRGKALLKEAKTGQVFRRNNPEVRMFNEPVGNPDPRHLSESARRTLEKIRAHSPRGIPVDQVDGWDLSTLKRAYLVEIRGKRAVATHLHYHQHEISLGQPRRYKKRGKKYSYNPTRKKKVKKATKKKVKKATKKKVKKATKKKVKKATKIVTAKSFTAAQQKKLELGWGKINPDFMVSEIVHVRPFRAIALYRKGKKWGSAVVDDKVVVVNVIDDFKHGSAFAAAKAAEAKVLGKPRKNPTGLWPPGMIEACRYYKSIGKKCPSSEFLASIRNLPPEERTRRYWEEQHRLVKEVMPEPEFPRRMGAYYPTKLRFKSGDYIRITTTHGTHEGRVVRHGKTSYGVEGDKPFLLRYRPGGERWHLTTIDARGREGKHEWVLAAEEISKPNPKRSRRKGGVTTAAQRKAKARSRAHEGGEVSWELYEGVDYPQVGAEELAAWEEYKTMQENPTRYPDAFYIVDIRIGKAVAGPFSASEADHILAKSAGYQPETHQVISGWALSPKAFTRSKNPGRVISLAEYRKRKTPPAWIKPAGTRGSFRGMRGTFEKMMMATMQAHSGETLRQRRELVRGYTDEQLIAFIEKGERAWRRRPTFYKAVMDEAMLRAGEAAHMRARANPQSKRKHARGGPRPKRRKTPQWQLLINRCQKLWTHYCDRPSKKRLEAIYVHLDKMKESKSKKVATERSKCLRAANKEAKRIGYKRKK